MSLALEIKQLDHTYLAGTPLAQPALHGVNLSVERGQIAALVGASGAGKSTLAHYVNGLERPAQAGQVRVLGRDLAVPSCSMAALRQDVALVFQYPHHQLLERFVGDDVAYGPRQLDLSREEIRSRVVWAMQAVGLDFDLYVDRATFGLSGGEMRRVALAGALAMQPKLLVLDEATTGLDPQGRRRVHALLQKLNQEQGMTVLLVSNDMDEVAALCDTVTVLQEGRVVASDTPHRIFAQPDLIASCGLLPPQATELSQMLALGGLHLLTTPVTPEEAEEALWQALQR